VEPRKTASYGEGAASQGVNNMLPVLGHRASTPRSGILEQAPYSAPRIRFRNKIGLGVAIEALRDCWRQRKATIDEIWAAAKVCRVTTIVRPYLESIV